MRRRDVLALWSAAASWPLVARGEPRKRIGCLVTGSPASHGQFFDAFRQRLAELGYVGDRNVILDVRWADGLGDRLPALAGELATLVPDLVVTATAAAALAVKQVMPTVPIVAATLIDPIGLGLVASLADPGGNVTGTLLSFETLVGKQLEVAREVIPRASRIGLLINPTNPVNSFQRENAEAAAPALGLTLAPVEARLPDELDAVFQTFARERTELVVVLLDAMFITERRRVASLALGAGMATVAGTRDMAEAGGLVSYGIDLKENWRRAAYFSARILGGAKPADLPVELPSRYEFVVNLKTAMALGLTISPTLLARADEVIE